MPDPFPATGAEVEALVRQAVAEKVGDVDGVGNVFSKPFYVSGKQQYVEKLGIDNVDGDVEVRYLFIDWGGWQDTDKGCDENPVYFLLYQLRIGQEFIHERTGGGSSSEDFAAQCMALRDAFRVGRDFGYPQRLYSDLLIMSEEVALHDDPHTGMFGHTVEFLLKVEVTPIG
jgi:hypothetical protein